MKPSTTNIGLQALPAQSAMQNLTLNDASEWYRQCKDRQRAGGREESRRCQSCPAPREMRLASVDRSTFDQQSQTLHSFLTTSSENEPPILTTKQALPHSIHLHRLLESVSEGAARAPTAMERIEVRAVSSLLTTSFSCRRGWRTNYLSETSLILPISNDSNFLPTVFPYHAARDQINDVDFQVDRDV